MADVSKEEVIEYLSGLNVIELSELVDELEDEWGVEASAGAVAAVPSGGGAEGDDGQHRIGGARHLERDAVDRPLGYVFDGQTGSTIARPSV